MKHQERTVYGGVDTHQDVHVAAVIDHLGTLLGTKSFPTTPLGLRSLERWLTARYCLYATSRGGHILRADINHDPWLLQPADAEITVNTMASVQGITIEGPPLLHFAGHTDVVAWGVERVR